MSIKAYDGHRVHRDTFLTSLPHLQKTITPTVKTVAVNVLAQLATRKRWEWEIKQARSPKPVPQDRLTYLTERLAVIDAESGPFPGVEGPWVVWVQRREEMMNDSFGAWRAAG